MLLFLRIGAHTPVATNKNCNDCCLSSTKNVCSCSVMRSPKERPTQARMSRYNDCPQQEGGRQPRDERHITADTSRTAGVGWKEQSTRQRRDAGFAKRYCERCRQCAWAVEDQRERGDIVPNWASRSARSFHSCPVWESTWHQRIVATLEVRSNDSRAASTTLKLERGFQRR